MPSRAAAAALDQAAPSRGRWESCFLRGQYPIAPGCGFFQHSRFEFGVDRANIGFMTTSVKKSSRQKAKDPYWDAIGAVWPHILRAYADFKDKKPIIEYELPRQMIYAYPALDYINDLSVRDRSPARQQYRKCSAAGEFLLFVRDTDNQVLRSYAFPVEDVP